MTGATSGAETAYHPRAPEVHVPSQESEWSSICVLGASSLPPSTFYLLDFITVPTV